MVIAILAILGGLVAASSYIISKRPNAQGFIATVAEYKGFIGVILTLVGLMGIWRSLFQGIANTGGIISLALWTAEAIVGFLLAYDLYKKYFLSKSPKASEMGAELKKGIEKYQVPAGLILFVLGFLRLISILF